MTEALARRWKMVAAVCTLCVFLSAIVTLLLPHRYESEMKFLVNNKRVDFVITPGESSPAAPPAEVSETEVNSEIELLKSHDILEGIVLSHQLYKSFGQGSSASPSPRSVALAADKLSQSLKVTALRKTNIIDVTYRDADPDTALAVLRDIGDRYLTSHLLAHGSHGSTEFFSEQVRKYSQALTQARTALSSFHQQKELFSMPQQQAYLVQRLGDVSSRLEDVKAQIHMQESRMTEGNRQLSQTPERVVTQIKQTSDQLALQQLEPTLLQLENRRIELLTKFVPGDRMVTQVDEQIVKTRGEIEKIREERLDEKTTDLDVVHQTIKAESAKTGMELEGLRAERVQLQQMHLDGLRQLGNLDQSSVMLQELERNEKEAQDSYVLYNQRLNEARLAGALDRDNFSNVAIIERPVASPIAVTPRTSLNLAAGLIFGILLSSFLVFYLETRQPVPDLSMDLTEAQLRHMQDVPLGAASGD